MEGLDRHTSNLVTGDTEKVIPAGAKFGRRDGRVQWHLLTATGGTRCGATKACNPEHWAFAENLDATPEEYSRLCGACMAPQSDKQMTNASLLRRQTVYLESGLENQSRSLRRVPLTIDQERLLLAHGFTPRQLEYKNRAWAVEQINAISANQKPQANK